MRPGDRGGRSSGSISARADPALRGREVSQMPVGPDARPGARTDTADPIPSPVVSDAARRPGEAGLPSHAVPRPATLPPDSLRKREKRTRSAGSMSSACEPLQGSRRFPVPNTAPKKRHASCSHGRSHPCYPSPPVPLPASVFDFLNSPAIQAYGRSGTDCLAIPWNKDGTDRFDHSPSSIRRPFCIATIAMDFRGCSLPQFADHGKDVHGIARHAQSRCVGSLPLRVAARHAPFSRAEYGTEKAARPLLSWPFTPPCSPSQPEPLPAFHSTVAKSCTNHSQGRSGTDCLTPPHPPSQNAARCSPQLTSHQLAPPQSRAVALCFSSPYGSKGLKNRFALK